MRRSELLGFGLSLCFGLLRCAAFCALGIVGLARSARVRMVMRSAVAAGWRADSLMRVSFRGFKGVPNPFRSDLMTAR